MICMEKPLISVIIPVYNTEAYLDKCVRSVLAQDYENFELILVDDGSTDSSSQIMDDEYILLISFDFDGLNRFCNSCRLLFCIVLHEHQTTDVR